MKKIINYVKLPISIGLWLFLLHWPAGLRAQTNPSLSRPLTSYERFVLESGMVNQVQNILNKYMDPAAYQLKISIEGRMMADSENRIEEANKSVPANQKEMIDMLPGLAFFDAIRQTEVPDEGKSRLESESVPKGSLIRGGPEILRMRIFLTTDTSINKSEADFYEGLVRELTGLNTRRGDVFTWKQVIFPAFGTKSRGEAAGSNSAQPASAGDDSTRDNAALLAEYKRMSEARKYETIILLAGIALLIIVLVVILRRPRKTDSQETGRNSRGEVQRNEVPNTVSVERVLANEISMGQPNTEKAPTREDKMLKWLLYDQRKLVLLVEKFADEQGPGFLQKLAVLLKNYKSEYVESLCSALNEVNQHDLKKALKNVSTSITSIGENLALIDMLDQAFTDYNRHGFFPFVLFMSDNELVDLLRNEQPIGCLMVLDGLPDDRKTQIMKLFEPKKMAEMICRMDELQSVRYSSYELLSSSLFEQVNKQRALIPFSEQNLSEIVKSIKAQSVERQEVILNDLRIKNRKLFKEVQKHVILWSDLEEFSESQLRQGIEIFNTSQLIELLRGDKTSQNLLLPLRPAREQIMIKEKLESNNNRSEESDALRKQFLETLYPLRAKSEETDKAKAKLVVKN